MFGGILASDRMALFYRSFHCAKVDKITSEVRADIDKGTSVVKSNIFLRQIINTFLHFRKKHILVFITCDIYY